MTVSARSYLRGRQGDEPVYSMYATGGGPGWAAAMSDPHEALGLEDLDDGPAVAVPIGYQAPTAVSTSGGPVRVLFDPTTAVAQGLMQAQKSLAAAAQPPSGGGAAATPVLASGATASGDKGFYAEVINPEHPQYAAAQKGLQTAAPEEVQKFAANVREGIQQAVTGQTATNWLGSILGAGIGGPGLGTGALPGILGQRAQELFGSAGLPPGAVWGAGGLRPTRMVDDPAWMSLANDVDRVGRVTVERLLGATQPQLDGIRRLLEHRANQVTATSEHQRRMELQNYMREVLGLLQHIAIRTGARTPIDFAVRQFAANGGVWRRY